MKVLLLIFLSIPLICFSQHKRGFWIDGYADPRYKGDTVLRDLSTNSVICDEFISESGLYSVNFKQFKKYAANYPRDMICGFLGKEYMLSIRVYSLWALCKRQDSLLVNLADDLLKDTSIISFYMIQLDRYPVNVFVYELFAGNIDSGFKPLSREVLIKIREKYNIRPFFRDRW